MKLFSIQYLRALAAIAVVLTHASVSLFNRERALIPFSIGAGGVDLFFVISGFIMFYTTTNAVISSRIFYLKRLIRIYPLYFTLTLVAFVLACLAPRAFNTFSANPIEFISSILFVPYYNSRTHVIQPEIGQGWTLNYEMFFYLIFGMTLYFRDAMRLILCASVFVVLVVIGLLLSLSAPALITYTNSIILEFLFGMSIAYILTHVPQHFDKVTVTLFLSGVVVGIAYILSSEIANFHLPRVVLAGIPSAAIVSGAIWLERADRAPKIPFLIMIGDASYSLYLSHGLVLGAIRRIWARLFDVHSISTHVSFMVIATATAIAASIPLHGWLERPTTRYLSSLLKPDRRFVGSVAGAEQVASDKPIASQ